MTSARATSTQGWSLMGQAEPPPAVLFGAVCPGLGRGGKAAIAAGARVLPVQGIVIYDEEL
jgi:hypothetical protein